jgi:hypothetical protein
MLSYQDNSRIVAFALSQGERLETLVAKPMATFASTFVKAYLKAKTSSLGDITAFGVQIGSPTLLMAVDKLTATEALALLKRLDPASASQATEDPTWMRNRLSKVLTAEVVPTPFDKAPRATKKSAPRKNRSVMGETDAFAAKRSKPTKRTE